MNGFFQRCFSGSTAEPPERRRQGRVKPPHQQLRISGGTQSDGIRFTVDLLDLGPYGLRLGGAERLKPGTLVRVSPLSSSPLANQIRPADEGLLFRVQWYRRVDGTGQMGLRIEDDFARVRTSWMMSLLREFKFESRIS